MAARWAVPGVMLLCQADPETIRQRLQKRSGDASDADWAVYLGAAQAWEEPGAETRPMLYPVPAGGSERETLAHAVGVLQSLNLIG
jgi:predicted kinase